MDILTQKVVSNRREPEVLLSNFFHVNEGDRVWWTHDLENVGRFLFSFDKKKIYNLFGDYPSKLSEEELDIFNAENPYWVEFFSDRLT